MTAPKKCIQISPTDHMHIARAYAAMSTRYAQLANCSTCSEEIRQGFKESTEFYRNILEQLEMQNG